MTPAQIEELVEAVESASGELIDMVRSRLLGLLQEGGLMRDAIRWRNHMKYRCGKYHLLMDAVEAEFQLPFWDVIRGFAKDGHSRSAAGEILGFEPNSFRRFLRNYAPKGDDAIQWPARNESLACKERQWTKTEKRIASAMANLKKAQEASGKERKRTTKESVELCLALLEQGISYRTQGHFLERHRDALRMGVKRQKDLGADMKQLAENGRAHPQYADLLTKGLEYQKERLENLAKHCWKTAVTDDERVNRKPQPPKGKPHETTANAQQSY